MMSDERNFRTPYYEKIGYRGVEEKKSIEIRLKEQPLDLDKLRQFCLRFPVPAMYRIFLWKVILGIIPANQDSHLFVMTQRQQQFKDLHHCLQVMQRIDDHTPMADVFLKMYLIEEGTLPFEEHDLLMNPGHRAFVSMAAAVCGIVDDNVDGYWITTKFYRMFEKCKDSLQHLPEKTGQCLKKEDKDQKLWNHLQKHQVWSYLPLTDWFRCCFAGILPNTSFEKVWDKVVGGSYMLLVYVAVAMFLTFRRPLLSMNSREEMVKYLQDIPEDSGDILVSQAIDLWQKHGGHLIQTKSDSPNFLDRPPS